MNDINGYITGICMYVYVATFLIYSGTIFQEMQIDINIIFEMQMMYM